MPRTRTRDFDLPPRCSRRGKNGKISYKPRTGGRITFHDIPKNATVKQIWDEYEKVIKSYKPHSLTAIADAYFNSLEYRKYADRTKKDHQRYLVSLNKVFGDSDMSRAQPSHITRWRNKRAETAKEQANKELSFLRVVLGHAVEVGLLRDNPALKVKKLSLTKAEQIEKRKKKRASYVTKAKYDKFYDLGGPVLKSSIEILYCTGIRMGDLLRLKWQDVHFFDEPEMGNHGYLIYGYVDIDEGKGINEYRKDITPRLLAALRLARKLPGVHISPYVIHNRRGQKYTEDGFGTLWQYTRLKLEEPDRFGIHKVRSKAITDWKGTKLDKWMFSRHKSDSMIDTYDTSIPTAPSH